MSVHTYVGARYVPRFMGTYDPTQQYEALDVVDNGSGTSYISKIITPAGTPLTDTDHWALYGASSGAIINLQNQIDTINNTDLPGIRNDISDIQAEVDDIKSEKRRIVCVTDSYGTHSATNWAARTFANLDVDPSTDGYLFAEGSSGFNHVGLGGHTFETLLSSNVGYVSDPDSITDVIFGGGTNDFYYYTTKNDLVSAIQSAIAYAKTEFTNARIWVAFMGYFVWMLPAMREHYYDTIAIYGSYSITSGARFINAYWPMHSYFHRDDTQHPNEYGNQAISEIVSANLRGCNAPEPLSCDVYGQNYANSTITPRTDNDGTSGTWTLAMAIKGDNALFKMYEIGLVKTGGWTLTAGNNFEIGTYDLTVVPLVSANDFMQMIPISVTAGGVNSIMMARVAFIDSGTNGIGKIVIEPVISLANVTFMQLKLNIFELPLICA